MGRRMEVINESRNFMWPVGYLSPKLREEDWEWQFVCESDFKPSDLKSEAPAWEVKSAGSILCYKSRGESIFQEEGGAVKCF